MGNVRAWLSAVVMLLAVCGPACSRNKKSKELAALNTAYNSGVLTKGEYEVKKSVVERKAAVLAALDRALDAGILTRDEYANKKAALLVPGAAVPAAPAAQRNEAPVPAPA